MTTSIWFDKSNLNDKESKEIINYFIKKFKQDEFVNKEGKKNYVLMYPIAFQLNAKDDKYLGLSLQFSSSSLIFFPNLNINIKYDYNSYKKGYAGKEYYITLKKEVENCIKKTKEYYSKKSDKEKSFENYKSQLAILNAFLEFAKTGIEHPNLIMHPD